MSHRVAYVVTSHGFGHAARAAAVMAALQRRPRPPVLDVYTGAPSWIFEESLRGAFAYHHLVADVGVVQDSPLVEDLEATAAAVSAYLADLPQRAERLGRELTRRGTDLVICDIAPLGLAAAAAAGLPSLLVENFTWDRIYEPYAARVADFADHAARMAGINATARWRIQAAPACRSGAVDLAVGPVARRPRSGRERVRRALGVPLDEPLVLVALGGLAGEVPWLGALEDRPEATFLFPGVGDAPRRRGKLLTLPRRSGHYHPDLTGACDAVIGKAGYSTLAEAYHAGLRYGIVGRRAFGEAETLVDFARAHMAALAIDVEAFERGAFLDVVPELLALPAVPPVLPNGDGDIAAFVDARLHET